MILEMISKIVNCNCNNNRKNLVGSVAAKNEKLSAYLSKKEMESTLADTFIK